MRLAPWPCFGVQVVKIGDEFFTFIVDCKEPKACTVLLRGASRDILNEVRAGAWLPGMRNGVGSEGFCSPVLSRKV